MCRWRKSRDGVLQPGGGQSLRPRPPKGSGAGFSTTRLTDYLERSSATARPTTSLPFSEGCDPSSAKNIASPAII